MSRKLKDWLDGYLAYTNFTEAPLQFNFWAGVSVIAGALRKKAYIDQLYFRWSPNFYIIFVAPSGIATKSTAMDAAMDLLREVDGIFFGANSMTWQAMVIDLHKAEEEVAMPGGKTETQACLTFASRELGSLINFTDMKLVDVLVDLYDGKDGSWRKATQTYGDQTVKNPWINIAACTTPSWISHNMPRQLIGGGFTSRCIFVYGDKKRQLIPYPKKQVLKLRSATWFQDLRDNLVHDLNEIASIAGEYELTPEAEEFGVRWYHDLWEAPPKHLLVNDFGGYISRKQGHIHRVAMVVAAAYTDERRITLDDLTKAIALVDGLEADMVKVFSHIKSDPGGQRNDEVMAILRVYKELPRDILFRMAFTRLSLSKADFDSIINSAIDAGAVAQGAGLILRIQSEGSPYQTSETKVDTDAEMEDHESEGSGS